MAKLNLDFYKGIDLYSDGDVEDEILHIVKNCSDYTAVLHECANWPIMYHLSPARQNLLQWYNFNPEGNLLEIGGGCGAFTGMFASKLKEVKVVELSRKRSEIIYNRYKNHENVEIYVGNLNDIKFESQFEYITLIGVLEYAGKFTESQSPYKSFLEKVKGYLRPNGQLIVAIENKFGLKYWAGAREDHSGRHFDSIENYPYSKSVQTFGKEELSDLFHSVGFEHLKYYYPMPDYKLPKIIYSDDYLPDETAIFDIYSPNFDQPRYTLFNENLAFQNIIKNKMFNFFANSFLVFVS